MKIRIPFGWSYAAIALALFLLGAGNAFAQATASGTIQGTVFDQSQAIVIGAEVVVTNKATGEKRTASTNNEGNYRFDLLSAGGYAVRVTRQGFAATVQNVDLLVGQTTTANLTLTPGATTEVVEVTAAAALVDMGKSGVSANITPTEVEDLPMVGRDVANLAYLAPGVKAADSYDPTKNRYAILSVNGAGGRNVNVTVNGVDNKDNTVGGPVMQLPLEAVQEFQISTQRFSAENGRSEGAAINMITKQGTNTYHGSVFGYFRNTALDTDEKDPERHRRLDRRASRLQPAAVRRLRRRRRSRRTSCSASSPSSASAKARAWRRPARPTANWCWPKPPGSRTSPPPPSPVRSTKPATTAAWTGPSTARTAPTSATTRRPTTA